MPDSDHVTPIGTTRSTFAICSVFIMLRGISQCGKYWKKWVQEGQETCQCPCLFLKSYYNLLAEMCFMQISGGQPASISKVLFYREEACRKIGVPKYSQHNHNFTILACFSETVRLKIWEALSVRLLPLPFSLIFKFLVQCKQNFKKLVPVR